MVSHRRSRRTVRAGQYRAMVWIAVVGFALIVIVGGFAAFRLARIEKDLSRASKLLESAGAHIEQGQIGPAQAELARAQLLLTRANGDLYGKPEFDLVGRAPVVGENLDSLRDSVGVALRLVNGGNKLLELTRPLQNEQGKLEVPLRHGTIPLATVRAAELEAADLASALPGRNEQPSTRRLVGPVADMQRRIFAEAGRRRSQLDSVGRALTILEDMAGGNGARRYLIAVANSAEMRGAGGMPLSYGVLESDGGTFTLGDFGNIDELTLDAPVDPASLALPQDYVTRWTGQQPTFLWRNTTLAPELSFDAPAMEAMFTAKTTLPVDGVIQIDPAGLAAILKGTGPVEVDGLGTVTADNVVDLTINRAYIDFPNRDQRQELLGDVARKAFDALINGEFSSLRPLGDALFTTAQQRHVIFFANDRHVRDEVAFFGADGALPSPDQQDYALLTVQNFSKNKLDYYIDSRLDIVGTRPSGKVGHVTATVTVTNTAPPGSGASYVFGPNAVGEVAGLYRGVVSLYLPTGASLSSFSGGPTTQTPASLSEAGRTAVSFGIDVPAGETRTVVLDLVLAPRSPLRPYTIVLVPAPRVRPTVMSVDLNLGDHRLGRVAAPLLVRTTLGGDDGRAGH